LLKFFFSVNSVIFFHSRHYKEANRATVNLATQTNRGTVNPMQTNRGTVNPMQTNRGTVNPMQTNRGTVNPTQTNRGTVNPMQCLSKFVL
jgi:hypothetical protein